VFWFSRFGHFPFQILSPAITERDLYFNLPAGRLSLIDYMICLKVNIKSISMREFRFHILLRVFLESKFLINAGTGRRFKN
jgi:hypothetical protein